MCVSPLCHETRSAQEATSVDSSGLLKTTVNHNHELGSVEDHSAPVDEGSWDQEGVVVFETSLLPIIEVEMVQLPPSPEPCRTALDGTLEAEESCLEVSKDFGMIVRSSPASFVRGDGQQVIRCFQVAS